MPSTQGANGHFHYCECTVEMDRHILGFGSQAQLPQAAVPQLELLQLRVPQLNRPPLSCSTSFIRFLTPKP